MIREKEQLEQKLAELCTKKNLSQIEEVIIEEVEHELAFVISQIKNY